MSFVDIYMLSYHLLEAWASYSPFFKYYLLAIVFDVC